MLVWSLRRFSLRFNVLWKHTAISLRCKNEDFSISERYCSQSLFLFCSFPTKAVKLASFSNFTTRHLVNRIINSNWRPDSVHVYWTCVIFMVVIVFNRLDSVVEICEDIRPYLTMRSWDQWVLTFALSWQIGVTVILLWLQSLIKSAAVSRNIRCQKLLSWAAGCVPQLTVEGKCK